MSSTPPPRVESDSHLISPADRSLPAAALARARAGIQPTLPEAYRTIPVAPGSSWLRKAFAFAGPGYLVAVGYMDPGNWATDLGGGSKFGYTLLSVVLLSSLMAMLLQALSAKLGIVMGRDLAQACRESYSRRTTIVLWVLCEIAIAACDLAEVLGSAVALKLLFGLPLLTGVLITAFDVLIVLALQGRGFRLIESFVITLIATLAVCFAYEIFFVQPLWHQPVRGLLPVAEIKDAYQLLTPVLGAGLASTLFALALLASGQNSTLTGTLAGQIVMEGFLDLRLRPWVRRLITRALAIIPAAFVIGFAGEGKVTALLILSQVILSFQLPFAVIPLVRFTNDRGKMGAFANSRF